MHKNYEQKTTSQKLFRNSFFSELKVLIAVLINLLIIPYVMKKMGIVNFGTWSVFTAIMGIIGLFDMGLTTNLTRLITKYSIEKDHHELNILVNTTFSCLFLLGLIIFIGILVCEKTINNTFFTNSSLDQKQIGLYIIIFAIFGILNLFQVAFNNILVGIQEFGSLSKFNIVSNIINSLTLLLLLYFGLGLFGIAVATGLALIFLIFLEIILIMKRLKYIKVNYKYIKPKRIPGYLKYSFQVSLTSIANTLIFQGNKFIITYFFGLASSGYYDVALRIVNQIRVVPMAMLETVLPISSEMQAKKMMTNIKTIYKETLRNFAIVLFPMFVTIIIYAPIFVRLWLGKNIHQVAISLQYLALIQIINLLTGPSFLIQTGLGRPKYGAVSAFITILSNFILFPLLCWKFGYQGGLVGLILSFCLATILYLYFFHRSERIKIFDTISIVIPPLLISFASIFIVYKIFHSFINNMVLLSILGSIGVIIYIVTIIVLSIVKKDEIMSYIHSF